MQEIRYDSENREKLLAGIQKLERVVVSTLGPRGRTVIIDKEFGNPLITKDGVTVAKEVNLDDPIENLGKGQRYCDHKKQRTKNNYLRQYFQLSMKKNWCL